MTEFERAVNAKIAAAKKEGEEDIKYKIVKALEGEFLNLIPTYIPSGTEIKTLEAETIWIVMAGYKGEKEQYSLIFNKKEKIFESYEEVEKFAKEIRDIFPHPNIDCHILNTIDWGRNSRIGSRVFGLNFSLKVN